MKLIKLTRNRLAIVDDEDFEWLSQWKWFYHRDKKTGYAYRNAGKRPHRFLISMHIEIMRHHQLWKCSKEVDHINTCGCDNRKENLRLAALSDNLKNKRVYSNNTSGITGVRWQKEISKWRARITINGELKHLGCFSDKDEATAVRREAEIKYFGEYRHDPTRVCPLGYTGQCPECFRKLK